MSIGRKKNCNSYKYKIREILKKNPYVKARTWTTVSSEKQHLHESSFDPQWSSPVTYQLQSVDWQQQAKD